MRVTAGAWDGQVSDVWDDGGCDVSAFLSGLADLLWLHSWGKENSRSRPWPTSFPKLLGVRRCVSTSIRTRRQGIASYCRATSSGFEGAETPTPALEHVSLAEEQYKVRENKHILMFPLPTPSPVHNRDLFSQRDCP